MREERKGWITVAIFAVFLVGLGIAFGAFLLKERPGPVKVVTAQPPPLPPPQQQQQPSPPVGCPELAGLNLALVDLPIETLESQLVTGSGLPPSSGAAYLESLKASLVSYAPEKRACMYRVLLVQARGSAAAVRKGSGVWGLDKPSAEIGKRFFEAKLKNDYTRAQREDLLAQVEEYVIPNLAAKTDGDREYWRRLYYGLLLLCEADDATLKVLEAERPRDCLHFTPRDPPREWQAENAGSTGEGVAGALSPEVVREVIRKERRSNGGEYRACYEGASQRPGWNFGKVAVVFVVGEDGHVQTANTSSQTTNQDEVLNQCLLGLVRRWQFPTAGGTTNVSYTFITPKVSAE